MTLNCPRSAEGNIIHELDGGLLPARVIAEALESRTGDEFNKKDLEFYVGLHNPLDTGRDVVCAIQMCFVNFATDEVNLAG